MVQSQKCIDALDAYRREKALKKAKRLVELKPKWEDEIRMDMNKIEQHCDATLDMEHTDVTDRCKAGSYALKFMDLKLKYSEVDANTEAELDMGALMKLAKTTDQPDKSKPKE